MGKFYSEKVDWNKQGVSGEAYSHTTYQKCAHSHPLLKLGKHTITGGACASPQNGPYDVEIALDNSGGRNVFPWDDRTYVHFPITDMAVPKDIPAFRKMIEWTAEQVKEGKKVHVGCIGGHGRTGMFLVALYAHMFPKKAEGAIAYVRETYCEKAVETSEQVRFLMKEYGVGKAKGYKEGHTSNYPSKGGGAHYLADDTQSLEEWWGGKQKSLLPKVIPSGKESGGNASPRPNYSGYGAHFNQNVPKELRVIEAVKKKGRLFLSQMEMSEILLAYEADYI